ncbi:unnamed protein product, partial [Hapterophycus canaliculatus]
RKLGLFSAEEEDDGLFESLFTTMAETSTDFTGTFRELAQVRFSPEFGVTRHPDSRFWNPRMQ